MMVIFFLLLIAVAAYAAGWRPQFGQWNQASRSATGSETKALDILRERYALGEISSDQYKEMRADLSK